MDKNTDQNSQPKDAAPSRVVRWCLVGLPLGLIITGVLSFVIYFHDKNNKIVPVVSQYAAMFRREFDANDFSRYQRIFNEEIGERSLDHPENLEAASAFIESTMGYDNMGYRVMRQEFVVDGKPLINLVAELPGKEIPNEVVIVLANYLSTVSNPAGDSAAVAAMFSLAHAMTGTEQGRTIRFVAVADSDNKADFQRNGSWHLAQERIQKGENVRKIIVLSVPPEDIAVGAAWPNANVQALTVNPALKGEDLLARLQEIRTQIELAAAK